MRHGYTNDTELVDRVVVKRYAGPEGQQRRARESAALEFLAGRLCVPAVLPSGEGEIRTSFVPGTHGQDLIAAGRGVAVLAACGTLLAALQAVPVDGAPAVLRQPVVLRQPAVRRDSDGGGSRPVLVHGDFGPNNLLLDPLTFGLRALLDWEWAHVGSRLRDLAWCEWIVRTHHPGQVAELDALFAAYGDRPSWVDRRAEMVRRCERHLRFCESWEPGGGGVDMWRERIAVTAGWVE